MSDERCRPVVLRVTQRVGSADHIQYPLTVVTARRDFGQDFALDLVKQGPGQHTGRTVSLYNGRYGFTNSRIGGK
ncbi:hypothetical protein LJR034_009302 [Caballeronia sp. LjRoot34]